MAIRRANANWTGGGLKDGKGTMAFGSGAFEGQYSFSSRFEEGTGTNPEELIAAAHAGCFAMALSAGLERAGFPPQDIQSSAAVHLTPKEGGGFEISKIDLSVEAKVDGIEEAQFMEIAEATKGGCPVSVALAAVSEITLDAKLV